MHDSSLAHFDRWLRLGAFPERGHQSEMFYFSCGQGNRLEMFFSNISPDNLPKTETPTSTCRRNVLKAGE